MSTGVCGVCVILSALCEWPPQTVFNLSSVLFSLYDHHHCIHRIADTLQISLSPSLLVFSRHSPHGSLLALIVRRQLSVCTKRPLSPFSTATLHHYNPPTPPQPPPPQSSPFHCHSPYSFHIFNFVCFSFNLYRYIYCHPP